MRKTFTIDWPDNYGEDYVNRDLIASLFAADEIGYVNVSEIPPKEKASPRPKGGHDLG